MRQGNTFEGGAIVSQDPNLPDGCTNAALDRHMGADAGTEDCEACDGTGLGGSGCCGATVGDDGRCAKCHDNAENESCEECSGKGFIEFVISERREDAKEQHESDQYEVNKEKP